MSKSTVQSVIQRINQKGSPLPDHGTGAANKKLSERDERSLVRIVRKDPFVLYNQILAELRSHEIHISKPTLVRYLHAQGFGSYFAAHKPKLTDKEIKERLRWAKERINWTSEKTGSLSSKKTGLPATQIKRFDKWPSNSPDLNPLEHVWACLEWLIAKEKAHIENIEELKPQKDHFQQPIVRKLSLKDTSGSSDRCLILMCKRLRLSISTKLIHTTKKEGYGSKNHKKEGKVTRGHH
ncbi:Homeodomain-like DNA binding domain-containing transcription factor [Mucor lusitanicus CBS 277.49]|uniref:Homeodomain-like DNA binding domain-containing transcription factor n=1 Tax=Mucor lusitanicus CBS 277.49 TaxID=747725 RepID=A0A168J6S4_MUCCL|nr:Homeodomain-like DNA binding domain-containing transcription factor [Mucor lusitanicus CBS 277.49]